MRSKVYIENTPLDLFDDIDASFTYAIDDIKDFGSRNTSFSKTIIIPGNSVNNKVFGNVFSFGSSNQYNSAVDNVGYNFNPAVSARCVVLVDNIQIFKGVLRLMEVIDTDGQLEYECFVSGELGGFMFQLGNNRLEDLDFSEYNLIYSYANILASWDNISGSGVYFPLIDYGNVSTDKVNFQYSAFRPALYVREYVEKIIGGTDYTVESNFFLSGLLDRLGIGQNQKSLTNSTSTVLTLGKTTTQNVFPLIDMVEWDSITGALFTGSMSNKRITYNSASAISISLNIYLYGIYKNSDIGFSVSIKKNGVEVAGSSQTFAQAVNSIWNYNKTVNLNLVNGDYIEVDFDGAVAPAPGDYVTLQIGSGLGISSTPTSVPIEIGDTIVINDSIPKGIFQRDFIIWLLKMFNLYVYESAFDSNKLYIEPYIDFYPTSAADALNWSEKIDRKSPIRSTPMSELNARFYNFKFKEDSDFYGEDYRKGFNQGYGDFIFDTEFEFSKDTDTVEVGFANSVLYNNVGTDKVYPAIYKLSGTTETPMDHVIRLLQFKKKTCDSWDMLDGVSVLGSQTTYGYGGHLNDPDDPSNDICFGAPQQLQFSPSSPYPTTNIFNAYHSAYLSEITDKDSKLVTCKAYLTAVDILNLDFSKLIYVDGVLFRINKIADYNPIAIDTTEIQLLKVIDL